MALPNGLPQNSDLGNLQGLLGNDALSPFLISAPYTTVVNRAKMIDPSRDLKVSMGIDRILTHRIYQIQDEFGPNGENVYSCLNDSYGAIRFVGQWTQAIDARGVRVVPQVTGDYVEITFYGTGLNLMTQYEGTAIDIRATVDNGIEGSNLFLSSNSSVLAARNYSSNQVVPVISGLSLANHTVRLRHNSGTTRYSIYGFEVINASSMTVNSGTYFNAGKK